MSWYSHVTTGFKDSCEIKVGGHIGRAASEDRSSSSVPGRETKKCLGNGESSVRVHIRVGVKRLGDPSQKQ